MRFLDSSGDAYGLLDTVDSLERSVSVELETGLRVQMLRAVPIAGKDKWRIRPAIKDDSGTWADITVTRRGKCLYVVIVHEE